MSSCDGVRPIVVRAGAVLPELVTSPHGTQGTNPRTGATSRCSGTLVLFCRQGHYCSGTLPETLRRHFLRAVAAAAFFRPCRCGDFGFVSRHKPAEHRIPDISATPDVEASSITSCCGRRVSLSLKDVAALQYVCSRGADNLSSISLSCSPCYRWFYGHCRMHHGCAVRMETVQVHVASSLSVVLAWWPRRTTPMAPDFLPRCQSEASQPTTKVTKHSAATVGQLPFGTGGEFLVDQRRIFGTSNRENFIDMFFHSVASNRKFPPTPTLRGTPSQYKRRNSGSASVLSQYASGRTTSNSQHSHRFPVHRRSLHWFRGCTNPSADLRSLRHLCNDRCRLETVEVQQFAVHRQGVLRLLRHHRNSCGRFRGSSSSRRRLSTRQVLLIQSPEDRVCPTGTGHGHDRQFPNCDTTPSTDNPDGPATTEFSQCQ